MKSLPMLHCLPLLLAAATATAAADAAKEATTHWSQGFALEPKGTELLGNAVNRVNKDWVLATALEQSQLTPPQRAEFAAQPRRFVLNDDFNRDGRPDRALTGVYQDRQGKRGNFVAIFTLTDDRQWQPVYSEVAEGNQQFGVLHQDKYGVRLYWTHCLSCPEETSVSWTGKNYTLVTYP